MLLLSACALGLWLWAWPSREQKRTPARNTARPSETAELPLSGPGTVPSAAASTLLRVFVHEGAAPIVDAEVVVAGPGRRDPKFVNRRTSTSGVAEFKVSAGEYGIRVTHREFPVATEQVVVDRASVEIDVALARGALLFGNVIDDARRPVAGAELQALRAGKVEQVRVATTGSDGSFVLPGLPLETLDVVVRAPGFRTRTQTFTLERHGERPRAVIELMRGLVVAGRVVTREGDGVANSRVGCSDGSVTVVTTDPTGAFELMGLAEGSVNLFAIAPGFATAHVRQVQPGTRNLEIIVDRPARLTGSVAVPLHTEFVDIAACHQDPTFERELCLVRVIVRPPATTYELRDVPPGDYEVVAKAEGHAERRVPVRLAAGDQLQGPTFGW